MRLSLSFMGISPIESTLPAVRAAERFGLDGVWSAEHIGFHDAIVPSALYLRETERLEVDQWQVVTRLLHPRIGASRRVNRWWDLQRCRRRSASPARRCRPVNRSGRPRPAPETIHVQ